MATVTKTIGTGSRDYYFTALRRGRPILILVASTVLVMMLLARYTTIHPLPFHL